MRKKIFVFQVIIISFFCIIALASSSSSSTRSSSSSYYSAPSSSSTSSSSKSYLQKADFPDPACSTCQGRKGYYLGNNWVTCNRCGGTGKEPKH